jgi:hypothetical protein
MTLQQLDALRDQLKNEMGSSSPNLQKLGQLLIQAKVNHNSVQLFLYVLIDSLYRLL